ncbi:MAG: hypothetical protein ACRYFS_19560 [Janthinobacterium lividum]
MKFAKLTLLALPALAVISAFGTVQPVAAASLQAMSFGSMSAHKAPVVNYWHHRHHHRHHHGGGGIVVRL